MIYHVTGTLGSGKTAYCVKQALSASRIYANFPISGLSGKFFLLPKNPDEWDQKIYTGYRRNTSHPKILTIIDELPEIANQFSRGNSSLLSYLRHSDKIGHTVYIISQRSGHSMKTIRQLAAETILIFYIFGKRMFIRIDGKGKPCSIPKPLSISAAFGHYDTAEIVSPNLNIHPTFLPLRSFRLKAKLSRLFMAYCIAASLIFSLSVYCIMDY